MMQMILHGVRSLQLAGSLWSPSTTHESAILRVKLRRQLRHARHRLPKCLSQIIKAAEPPPAQEVSNLRWNWRFRDVWKPRPLDLCSFPGYGAGSVPWAVRSRRPNEYFTGVRYRRRLRLHRWTGGKIRSACAVRPAARPICRCKHAASICPSGGAHETGGESGVKQTRVSHLMQSVVTGKALIGRDAVEGSSLFLRQADGRPEARFTRFPNVELRLECVEAIDGIPGGQGGRGSRR